MEFLDRLKHAWSAFRNRDPTGVAPYGFGSVYRPDRRTVRCGTERSIVNAVYNRIAMDVAAIDIRHVQLDDNDRFLKEIDSGLNRCLSLSANLDQTGRDFIHDYAMSVLDEGCVAIVPTEWDDRPSKFKDTLGIESLRVGKIVEWYPKHVRVELYNENTGKREEVNVPKNRTAIVENPFYTVMNEPNSTMQRLIRKLNILDAIDEQSGSGKLDLIIQLPYVIKTEARQKQAEDRRKAIEDQLANSKYGIAYAEATEKITQLNRPIENNLMKQIEYLTSMLYSQLGTTQSIMDGTANDKTMLNYYNRICEPLISALVDEMKRKFLTKTARDDRQSIQFFRDPFKLVPINELAEIVDKFTRNEIASSNEMRQVIGWKPSSDPNADKLLNKNLKAVSPSGQQQLPEPKDEEKGDTDQNG